MSNPREARAARLQGKKRQLANKCGLAAIACLAVFLTACEPANPERPRFQQTFTFDNGVTVHIYTAGPGEVAFSAKVEGSTIIFNNQKLDLARGDEVSVVARADKSITVHKGRL